MKTIFLDLFFFLSSLSISTDPSTLFYLSHSSQHLNFLIRQFRFPKHPKTTSPMNSTHQNLINLLNSHQSPRTSYHIQCRIKYLCYILKIIIIIIIQGNPSTSKQMHQTLNKRASSNFAKETKINSSMIDHIHNQKKLLASRLLREVGGSTSKNGGSKKISKAPSLNAQLSQTINLNHPTLKSENDSLYREKLKLIFQKHKDLLNQPEHVKNQDPKLPKMNTLENLKNAENRKRRESLLQAVQVFKEMQYQQP